RRSLTCSAVMPGWSNRSVFASSMSLPTTSTSTDDPAAAPSGASRSNRGDGKSARAVVARSRRARRETRRIRIARLVAFGVVTARRGAKARFQPKAHPVDVDARSANSRGSRHARHTVREAPGVRLPGGHLSRYGRHSGRKVEPVRVAETEGAGQ